MRKVTFKIDLLKSLYDLAVEQNPGVAPEKIKAALGDKEWKVIYTLYGSKEQKFPDRYSLTDYDGNRMNINDVEGGFEKSILNNCFGFYHDPDRYISEMLGVVEITDEDDEDEDDRKDNL